MVKLRRPYYDHGMNHGKHGNHTMNHDSHGKKPGRHVVIMARSSHDGNVFEPKLVQKSSI